MKIAIGCDQNAYQLKMEMMRCLESKGVECVDYGAKENEEALYPNVAHQIAVDVSKGLFNRAIIISGIGISKWSVTNESGPDQPIGWMLIVSRRLNIISFLINSLKPFNINGLRLFPYTQGTGDNLVELAKYLHDSK